MTDFDRQLLETFNEEGNGPVPAAVAAEELGVTTADVTRAARKLETAGLLEDTGYVMRFSKRSNNWQFIDTETPKTGGGMKRKPGASTVWRRTEAGTAALNA